MRRDSLFNRTEDHRIGHKGPTGDRGGNFTDGLFRVTTVLLNDKNGYRLVSEDWRERILVNDFS